MARSVDRWERLFRWLLPAAQRDAAAGDAAEEFAARAARDGLPAARRWYRRQVLRSAGPALVDRLRRGRAPRLSAERRSPRMASWFLDLRVAFRTLIRQPAFTATVIATLAIGIGTTTALFDVYRAVFLEPLPLPESGRLVFIMEQASFGCCGPASGPDYTDWVARQRTFSELGVINPGSFTLTGDGDATRVYGTTASASVFELLHVSPFIGRTFTAADQAAPSSVVLSYDLWQKRFGGRREVVGTTLDINEAPYTIIGVMPDHFDVPSPWLGTQHHQLYLPFADNLLQGNRGSHSYPVIGRLASGATVETAQADMDRIMRDLAREYPKTNADRTTKVFTAHDYMFGSAGRDLALILGAAALVLLIACGNIAGLQLARATGREAELAVRAALGASRGALIRLLFSESLIVATAGGLSGVLVSSIAAQGLRSVLPATIPRVDNARVDGWALLFALGASALTAVVFGVLPALLASRSKLSSRFATRGAGDASPRRERLRDSFIVGQIALGLVLANGAVLLVRSYEHVRGETPGFQASGVLTMSVNPSGARYNKTEPILRYYQDVLARVGAVPGVAAVGTISRLPLSGGTNGNALIEGQPPRSSSDRGPLVEVTSITGDYFNAMGITLQRGRTLTPDDQATTVNNVVINRHFAHEAWPNDDALGKRFSFNDNPPSWLTVVGIVDDIRQWGPERPPVSQAYCTISAGWASGGYVVVRTDVDPGSLAQPVRRAILAVDGTQAPSDVQTMSARVDRAFSQRRFYTVLIGLFAAAALLLAGAGVYGTITYYVARRTRELGIRVALGASGSGIVGMVVRRGATLAVLGVIIGLAGVWASTSVISAMLYGVGALDASAMIAGGVTLAVVAVLASALPARRASRISPIVALRAE